MSDWNDKIIAEFRDNKGVVGGPFTGSHLLLLTTEGAKSGLPRIAPVMYFERDGVRMIIASKGGAPEHPAWYHNLLANPAVHIEAATESGIDEYDAVASVLSLDARDAAYAEFAALRPGFGEYQEKTDRVIPIVALTPQSTPTSA
jgi:deazaflavin-dependent oxidoreductase (nitroreductase family)